MSVTFNPIGEVKFEDGNCFIVLKKEVIPATLGLDEYSHIQVVWCFHLYDNEDTRKYYVLDKPYAKGPEKIGVFATRSPVRPNPIGITSCVLVKLDRAQNRLQVAGLDAENGTPILDIKPYEPSIDRVRDVKMPLWCAHWPAYVEDNATFDWRSEFNFPE